MTAATTIVCTRWRALERNTLQGFADLYIVRIKMTIRDCALHRKGDKEWIAFPSKPRVRDGAVVMEDGKAVYDPPLVALDDDVKERFRDAAVHAIRAKAGEPATA